MENQAYKPANPEDSRNYITPIFQHQNVPENEEKGEEWNYQEFLGLLQRRVVVVVGVATTVMTGVVIHLILNPKPPEYESSFHMLVEPVTDDTKVVDIVKETNPSNKSTLDYDSQILVLKSPELIANSIKQLQAAYPYINYNYLIKSLQIVRLGETKILQVSYRSKDPLESKVVLEQIAQEYLEYSQEKRQTRLRQGIQFLEKELPSLQNRVAQIQTQLQIFQQRYNFNTPESLAQQIAEQTANLTQQKQEFELQLAQARANYAFLQSEEGKKAVLDSYPVYQVLNSELRQVDIQIATALSLLQEENPNIITLKEKKNSLLPLIQQESERYIRTKRAEAASIVQGLEVNKQALERDEQILEQKRQQLPIITRRYTELQRQLQIATDSLNRFLSTRENLQIQVSQTEIGWQLIQEPYQPAYPVTSSNIIRDIIQGLAASIFLAIGAALLMEKLDRTYHNTRSLKERIKIPLLGNIPFDHQLQSGQSQTIKPQKPIIKFSNTFSETITGVTTVLEQEYSNYSTQFVEALRVLYTNIQLLNSDRHIRSITISSAMPGDGKSTIAFYLAQIATAMGQRVLLVDADLRQPQIHTLSNLNNLWGLSSLITSNLPVEEVVKQLPSMNALSVITAGPVPPDSTKLLSSEKMKRLMVDLHHTFDLVIYDAPPLVGLADASLIAPQTDGLVMVARIHQTDRSMFERALADLRMAPINVLGIVANGEKSNFNNYS
ncbi:MULTISPECIES: polysaccharide biosynthesis tyrosine autokinase [unclassified Anabaena]|uniref:GumC family protein n=1 Tax=unclassified Anabaena TaxID=2619674 RepID=UPI00082D98D5|nr:MULTISPECIES: polysaccharide biosynthesis tyrosine autokinase [unclassified Anabaena]